MTLTNFAKVVDAITHLKKPITDGGAIPGNVTWKETIITRTIRESFNGLAFTNFIFCVSQQDYNGGESWCTIKFAQNCSKMKSKVCKPKP